MSKLFTDGNQMLPTQTIQLWTPIDISNASPKLLLVDLQARFSVQNSFLYKQSSSLDFVYICIILVNVKTYEVSFLTYMMIKITFGQGIQSHQNSKHVTNPSLCILPNIRFHIVAFFSFSSIKLIWNHVKTNKDIYIQSYRFLNK